MAEISQWTAEKFKSVENDLLEKKRRHEQIPAELNHKEAEKEKCNKDIAATQKELTGVNNRLIQLEREKNIVEDRLLASQRPVSGEYANQADNYKQNVARQFAALEEEISKVKEAKKKCEQYIRMAQEKVRKLDLEIMALREEDKKIVESCRSRAQEMQGVMAAADGAASKHQGAVNELSKVSSVTKFGRSGVINSLNKTKETVKKYQDQKETANMLRALALHIANGNSSVSGNTGGTSQSSSIPGGGYSNWASNDDSNNIGSGASDNPFPRKENGATDFTKCSYSGEDNYNNSMTSLDLDLFYGDKYGLSEKQMDEWRIENGVVWHAEGDKVYLIHKDYTQFASSQGHTLEEWNVETPKVKALKIDGIIIR